MSNYEQFSEAKPWLSNVPPIRSGPLAADKEQEAYCTLCGARVTVGPDETEYGHFGDCDHRPSKFGNSANHKTAVTREKCEDCGRGFLNAGALSMHQRTAHADTTDVACPTCGDSYGSTMAMKVHHSRAHGETLDDVRMCKRCGQDFNARVRENQQFCSKRCADRSRRNREAVDCVECGETFFAKPSDVERGVKCCSEACRTQRRQERVAWECEECGEVKQLIPSEAAARTFCSPECQSEARRDRVTITCEVCGEEKDVKRCDSDRRFCSFECYNLSRGGSSAAAD